MFHLIQKTLGAMLIIPLITSIAIANDRAVSFGDRGPVPRTELIPSPGAPVIRAGQAFRGQDTFTVADLEANRAERVADAAGPDPMSPAVSRMMRHNLETIVGWDARMRYYTGQYPNRAIVYIQYNNAHLCTGFLVSRDTVVTSGHCVHTGGSNGAWRRPNLYRVFPGRDGTASPYGSCTVKRLHSVIGWTSNRNSQFDYGAMRLNCTIGNTTGWFGVHAPPNRELTNAPSTVIGYSGDKPQQQWGGGDQVRRVEQRMICYRNDTVGGNSGGPVWNDRNNATSATGAFAFGIHGYGVGGSVCGGVRNQMNGAVRVDSALLSNIVSWIRQP